MLLSKSRLRHLHSVVRPWISCLLLFIAVIFSQSAAASEEPNRLFRFEIKPHHSYTRLVFKLKDDPEFDVTKLPGKRVRVRLKHADSPLFKKYRGYSDSNIGGVVFRRRGNDVLATFATAETDPGLRMLNTIPHVLVIDVGPFFNSAKRSVVPDPERERIWSGAEKLIRDLNPPLKSDLPFGPTDRRVLEKLVPAEEAQLFLQGEAALYKGKAADAEEVFSFFEKKHSPISALGAYRLGEAQYLMEKYGPALQAFREGESLWPDYLNLNPSVVFYYADTLIRNGELAAARKMLTRLIARVADKKNSVELLVHLGDLYARMGNVAEAVSLYTSVINNFPGSKASYQSRLKLADRDFFSVDKDSYQELSRRYQDINLAGGAGFTVREEALFKGALLDAMHGPPAAALAEIGNYQKKFPRGIFSTIAKSIREELLYLRFHELLKGDDCTALLALAEENTDYLARCVQDPTFLPAISSCFVQNHLNRRELDLFTLFTKKEWAASQLPFLYDRMIEDATTLAEMPLAVDLCRSFVARFPNDGRIPSVRERLGRLLFQKNDFAGTVQQLSWLLTKGSRPAAADSYYILGKALAKQNSLDAAEKAMVLFLSGKGKGVVSPYDSDAYLVSAAARQAHGDARGVLSFYVAGYRETTGDQRDMFLYKIGELYRGQGMQAEAKKRWEQLVKEGTDPSWKKLAQQGVADLEWKAKYPAVGKGVSK